MCKKTIYFDCGNSQNKILIDDRKVVTTSNIEIVDSQTFGAWEVNGVSFINSEIAKTKKVTNKLCESRKLLIARNLFDLVEDKSKVSLSVLLPISQYLNKENRETFAGMIKGKYKVTNSEGHTKSFSIDYVDIKCEEFVALLTNPKLLQDTCYTIGVGSVDTSIFQVAGGVPNTNKIHTSENGISWFYDGLGRVLTSYLKETYTLQDARLVYKKYDALDDELKAIIDKYATDYIEKYIVEPLQELGFRKLVHRAIINGGGSLDLKRYIDKLGYFTYLDDSLFSNVIGSKILDQQKALKKAGK